jgi:predicted  nucleic acid-binding Zn-ribbon protein
MNLRKSFCDFFIEYEPDNVVYLNPQHARANAAQAAMALEDDRTATRKEEIQAELEELYRERERVNVRIFDLEGELIALKGGRCG